MANKMQIDDLLQRQSLPLEAKIRMTELRIRDWYNYWDGNVYVSFSGGKDSTVLLHIVRSMYPEVPAVYSDTGLEFPEIREFVKTFDNVTWLKPAMNFRKVIETHGYPVISKEQAQWIERARAAARNGKADVIAEKVYGCRRNGDHSRFSVSAGWRKLYNAPFKISAECCNEMKKKPLKHYAAETGRMPIIGTMASESKLRTQQWLKTGCNAYDAKRPTCKPMSFWLEQDVWDYIRKYNIPYCHVYDKGYARTGCIFCMFGAHLDDEPTRFQRLQRTHPQLWRYCMKDWDAGGLGMRPILEYLGVPYENFALEVPDEHPKDTGQPPESCGLQSQDQSETG